MRNVLTLAMLIAVTSGGVAIAHQDVTVAVSLDEDGVRGFRLAVSKHYRVNEQTMLIAHKNKIRDDELPVLFHIATHAHVGPEVVVRLRSRGKSWMAITAHYGLSAEIFYEPITGTYGPPYGRAYGHFKNKKRSEWASIKLADFEIVHLANVKFMSKHYGMAPDVVIKLHSKGASFVKFHINVKSHHAKVKGGRGGQGAGKRGDVGRGRTPEGGHKSGKGKSKGGRKGKQG